MWILYFLIYPQNAFEASCDGILLWFYQILPALLPYAILSSLVLASGLFDGKKNRCEWFIILCGFLFGFPIGSKLSADFFERGLISKKRAEILCCFTNNMSPVFVSSFVLQAQLQCPELILPTYLILYGIPLVYGILRLHFTPEKKTYIENNNKKPASRFELNMQIIDAGIINSFETMIRLCGYIVIFSIMAHMLTIVPLPFPWMHLAATGILEITNGTVCIASSALPFYGKYLMIIAALTFGGLSGIAQTSSMIHKSGLSITSYLQTKLILTVLTSAVAGVLIQKGL